MADTKSLDGKLIFLLSMFGLVMALATVWIIPSHLEPAFWLAIFAACAAIIARRAPKWFFLHGFLVSLLNCVWITSAHVLFVGDYLARHPEEAQMLANMQKVSSPRVMMAMTGPVVGIVSGVVLGLMSLVASLFLRKKAPATAAAS